ncbi:AAA family ATPase [Acetobacterium paludosum]|nr:AAA family ATPase [Acetobacterium paludosum]
MRINLIRATIHQYKCIETEQTFEIEKDITLLMGKNEAGKTSVLEALAKSNYFDSCDSKYAYNPTFDYPRSNKRNLDKTVGSPLAVTLHYHVSAELQEEIKLEMLLPVEGIGFSRITNYLGKHQIIDNAFEYQPLAFWEAYASQVDGNILKYRKKLANIRHAEGFQDFMKIVLPDASVEEITSLENIERFFENPHEWDNPINEYVFRRYLQPDIPKFMYYGDYHLLPSRVSLNRLLKEENLTEAEKTAKMFLKLADIDLDEVLHAQDFETYKTEIEITQANMTKELLKYWRTNQNLRIEFEIIREEIDHENINKKKKFLGFIGRKNAEISPSFETFLEIRVQNLKKMVSLPLENRSRGFNWFFSFWVWFSAIEKDNSASPYIFLLDEPGLNLHSIAQKDLMRLIGKLSSNYQIMITAHSPFLMEEKLDKVRCVVDKECGTCITTLDDEDDEETLFPVRYLMVNEQN